MAKRKSGAKSSKLKLDPQLHSRLIRVADYIVLLLWKEDEDEDEDEDGTSVWSRLTDDS